QSERKQYEREYLNIARDSGRQAIDLSRSVKDAERERYKAREQLEKESLRLFRENSRQVMDLIEQQATAERDLARARQDREAEKQRVGSLGNEIAPGFVMTANGLTRTQGLRSGATAG